ncbi:MAG: TrkH family potassium uptake protein [Acholeplasmataceae bacterium]|nr:TrkH family potassium uptake protein [Acholeplasmataceae bacterium]
MNYSIAKNLLGKILIIIAILMVLPLIVAIFYQEKLLNMFAFLIPMVVLFGIGFLLNIKKAKDTRMSARDGFIIVGLTWILMSLCGAIPLMISGEVPNFFDAFFEMSSGFTTTGASVIPDITKISHSILFWRSLSHWIGGMGILVFILAFIPESNEGSAVHILRAESPGPQAGKLVSKMKVTSRILYLIYITLTVILILLLWIGPDKKMEFLNSVIYALGTAGTGGFSMDASGLKGYSSYSQYVIAIFMLLFGVNFSIFYLILIGSWKEVFKNEELKAYFIIVVASVLIVSVNIYSIYQNAETSFRQALFQVASIISTTGYSSANFDTWPTMSKIILIFVMVTGACAGSTAGGVKIIRIIIVIKSTLRKIKNMVSPRKVEIIKVDGKPLNESVIDSVQSYIVVYIIIFLLCSLLISIDNFDLVSNLTASLTCLSNVGPGLGIVGPHGSFADFSWFSKFVLSLEMIAGRLELFPLLILFSPRAWTRRS